VSLLLLTSVLFVRVLCASPVRVGVCGVGVLWGGVFLGEIYLKKKKKKKKKKNRNAPNIRQVNGACI